MVVTHSHQKGRFAFTMIELIFAIVIISITVVSLPMMTQATSRSIDNNFVQEAIFAAGAEVMQAFSYRWDRNSAEDSTAGELSRIIDTAGDCNLSKRPGNIVRSCYSNDLDARSTVVANTADVNVENLNNIAVAGGNVFTGTDNSGRGYKKNYTVATAVTHPANFDGGNANNLKRVQITVTDPVAGTNVVLHAYSANIGETIPNKRSF